jgi:hypothetical protein
MTPRTDILRFILAGALVLGASACGGSDDEAADQQPSADATSQASAPSQSQPADAAAPLTVADLDAYERGMQKEKQMVDELITKAKSATSDGDKLRLMTDAMEDQTMDDGAHAAGMPLERYRDLRNRMSEILSASSFSIMGAALRQQTRASDAQLDTMAAQGAMTADQVTQSRKTIQETLQQLDAQEKAAMDRIAPDAMETFKQRAPHLDSLRMNTAGLRVKVAS